MRLPTVAIRLEDGSRAIINESDFDPERQAPFDAPLPGMAEDEARRSAVDIPSGWRGAHWKTLQALAGEMGVDVADKDSAVAVIEAELARRGA